MRRWLAAMGRKLGWLQPCGSLVISWTDPPVASGLTIGGPYFVLSEHGFEGPIYPSLWVDAAGSPPPAAADKPEEGETQAGAAAP